MSGITFDGMKVREDRDGPTSISVTCEAVKWTYEVFFRVRDGALVFEYLTRGDDRLNSFNGKSAAVYCVAHDHLMNHERFSDYRIESPISFDVADSFVESHTEYTRGEDG